MPDTTIAGRVLETGSHGVEIVDCHGHMGAYGEFYIPGGGTPESMVQMMDQTGIRHLCFSHHLAIGGDTREGNRIAYDVTLRYPDRFSMYIGYNPNYSKGYNQWDIDRYIGKKRVIGFKFHPGLHRSTTDDRRYYPACEVADEKKLIVLSHTWGIPDILGIEKAARMFRNVQFIMGHSGGAEHAAIYEAIRVARENENAYLDLCLSTPYEGLVELFVKEVSPEKVLFGSDIPFIDARANLGRVLFARISDSDKERILGGNMKTLLKSLAK